MKAIIFSIVFLLYLFILKSAFAATLSISGVPSSIDQSQEFQLNVNLVCSGCSDSYIRGVFYPSSTSYFGYTQDNNGNWSNAPGSSCTTFFKIAESDLINGSWSGNIKFKPYSGSVYYNGPGEYFFKIGRYTSSCSSPSTWSDEKIVAINGPTPTLVLSPTNSPTPKPTNSPSPTKTPTPTKTISKTPIPTDFISPTAEVLGEESNVSTDENKDNSNQDNNVKNNNFLPLIFISIGVVFLLACVIVFLYPKIKEYLGNKNE